MLDYYNKDHVDDEPQVHHLDADVVPEEVNLHHGHEPSEITSEENIRRQIQASLDPVKSVIEK